MEKARQHPALGSGRLALALALFLGLPAHAGEAAGAGGAGEVAQEGESVALASGLAARLLDIRLEEGDGAADVTLRLRFVAEGLAPGDDRSEDMQSLCEGQALPRIAAMDPAPGHVVITLADRAVPFGEAAPEAVQVFESYRIEGGACLWELF